MNGEDGSGKAPKRDTSENDRNRKAYRSGTVSLLWDSAAARAAAWVTLYCVPAAL